MRTITCFGDSSKGTFLIIASFSEEDNPDKKGLTLLSGRNMLLCLWYINSTLNVFFKCDFVPMITVHQGNGILAP